MIRPSLLALAFAASITPGMASAAPEWIDLSLQFNVTDAKDDQGRQLAPFVFSVDIGLRSSTRISDYGPTYGWEVTKFGYAGTGETPVTEFIAQSHPGYAQLSAAVPATASASMESHYSTLASPEFEAGKTYDVVTFKTASTQNPNPAGALSQYSRAVSGTFLIGEGRLFHEPTLDGIQERLTSLIGAPGFSYTEFYAEDALIPGSTSREQVAYTLVRGNATLASVSVVPEPASVSMLLAGLAAVGVAARRARKTSSIAEPACA